MLEITHRQRYTFIFCTSQVHTLCLTRQVHKSVHTCLACPKSGQLPRRQQSRMSAVSRVLSPVSHVSISASPSEPIPLWDLNRQQAAAIAEAARAKRISDATEEEASRRRKLPKKLASHSDRAAAKDEMLGQYPNIPLSEYSSHGDHLAINVDFPGLRAIHKDPWIFLVPDLLTQDECEQLMAKAEPHFQDSCSYSNGHRTCDECRIARSETQGIQSRYSKLVTALGRTSARSLCLTASLLSHHDFVSAVSGSSTCPWKIWRPPRSRGIARVDTSETT